MSGYVPRVTVGIPIYRGEKFILHAINSIRQDPFAEWEILIFDDHSPDSSRSVVEGLHDSRIRIIGSPVNRGLVYARNQIFAESRGEYVAWLDQDDLSHRGRLLAQVNFLDDRPAVSQRRFAGLYEGITDKSCGLASSHALSKSDFLQYGDDEKSRLSKFASWIQA